MDDIVRQPVAEIGFCAISALRWARFDHALVYVVVERWRPETSIFDLREIELMFIILL